MPAPGETIALKDVQRTVNSYGRIVKFQNNNDSGDVTRDNYKSIKKRSGTIIEQKSFPIRFSPSDKELSEAGMTEKVDVIVWTSNLNWSDATITFKDLYSYQMVMEVDSVKYKVTQKNKISHFGNNHLWITFGGVKR